jgi:hypothetical protein
MPVPDRTSPAVALLVAVAAFVVLWQVRHELDGATVVNGSIFRTLDVSVLYIIVLAPAAIAAYLVPSRWLLLGVVAAYLAGVAGELIRLAMAVVHANPEHHTDLPSASVFVGIAITSVPNAVLGVAGSALGLILARGRRAK